MRYAAREKKLRGTLGKGSALPLRRAARSFVGTLP